MIQCIGITQHGVRCENESPVPNDPRWPVYLCPTCANEPSRCGRRNSRGIVEQPRESA